MKSTLNYGRGIKLKSERWTENEPGSIAENQILEKIKEFYPMIFFDFLTEPVLSKVDDDWKTLIQNYIGTSVFEVLAKIMFKF